MTQQFSIGDRVAFKAAFCRSIFDFTDRPHWRGTVIATSGAPILRIMWDGMAGKSLGANAANLVRVDRIHLEPN